MRPLNFFSAFALAAIAGALELATPSAALAQQPTERTFTDAAEVQALIAAAAKKPATPLISQPLLNLSPFRANLEYRTSTGPAAVHRNEAEFFSVVEGAGTLVTGGTLVNEKITNPENSSGTAIAQGVSRRVAKGDVFIVPENTPHQFTEIAGTLVLISIHVPR